METVKHRTGATKKEIIYLSCDGLKDLALMADTEEGDLIRQYFIQAEKELRVIKQKQPAKLNPNYIPARTGCMNELKRHGAEGYTYAAVESYNNALCGLQNGQRGDCEDSQTWQLIVNYMGAENELLRRQVGFSKHQVHLQNTAKMAMRHTTYGLKGEDNVPEKLKPRHERKVLKSS